jgi:hypothetical protein
MTRPKKLPPDPNLPIIEKSIKLSIDGLQKRAAQSMNESRKLLMEVEQLSAEVDDPFLHFPIPNQQKTEPQIKRKRNGIFITNSAPDLSLGDTVAQAKGHLKKRNVDPPQNVYELLSNQQLRKIDIDLNRPMYERIKWDKWDMGFAIGSGILGGLMDILFATQGKFLEGMMADKSSWLGSAMEDIHKHHHAFQPLSPIDYRASGLTDEANGWAFHRGVSPGHDLLRFLSGISQIKNGVFQGIFYKNGVPNLVTSAQTLSGISYEPMGLGDAIVNYTTHMFCDFFSSTSLPIPGTSFAFESGSRELRTFVVRDLYEQGINLRHIVMQALPPIMISLIINCYCWVRFRKSSASQEAKDQKKIELLTVAHSISAGFNIGKIIFYRNPLMVNVPQLMAAVRNICRLVMKEYLRSGTMGKFKRNLREMRRERKQLEMEIQLWHQEPALLRNKIQGLIAAPIVIS